MTDDRHHKGVPQLLLLFHPLQERFRLSVHGLAFFLGSSSPDRSADLPAVFWNSPPEGKRQSPSNSLPGLGWQWSTSCKALCKREATQLVSLIHLDSCLHAAVVACVASHICQCCRTPASVLWEEDDVAASGQLLS